jgi:alkylation response protein AidB-like acyl-CoA dehydrogenase
MGLRGLPETEIVFENMAVSADALVLPPRGLRKGFADLMTAYNGQRIGAATVALGLAAGAYGLALAYTKEGEQFGRPICEFQGVQWMLADMTAAATPCRRIASRAVGGKVVL